jgi:hypothetical protein
VWISSPTTATYNEDQYVPVSYTCTEGEGGPGLKPGSEGCDGTLANGALINTSTPGSYEFKVTATSKSGTSTTRLVRYKVIDVLRSADVRAGLTAPRVPPTARPSRSTSPSATRSVGGAERDQLADAPAARRAELRQRRRRTAGCETLQWNEGTVLFGAPPVTHVVTFAVAPHVKSKVSITADARSAEVFDPNPLNNTATLKITLQ